MNKFIFVGSIAKDIEIKTTQTGKEMVRNTMLLARYIPLPSRTEWKCPLW